jgi:hypothetical protein
MKIYIASSWRNQHAVELLTWELERRGHAVLSFVRNGDGWQPGFDFDSWLSTPAATKKFEWDRAAIESAGLVVYLGPAGCDAWAEVGYAVAQKKLVLGLTAKGEQIGLMRKLVYWSSSLDVLLRTIDDNARIQG